VVVKEQLKGEVEEAERDILAMIVVSLSQLITGRK